MPNHIVNVVHGNQDIIEHLLNRSKSEPWVDFGRVIPEPKNLGGFMTLVEPGEVYWYDWRIENWGTKWNAYDVVYDDDDPNTLRFQTAWATPCKVFEALADQHPDACFTVEFADEYLGQNVGIMTFKDGILAEVEILSQTDRGYDMAAQFHYGKTYAEVQKEWDES